MLVTILLISFFVLLIIGVPISFSLSISAFLAVMMTGTIPVMTLVQKTFRAIDSFTLLAIPFFVFAGNVMARGGVSKKLTDIAATLVGRMPGGLAHVTTLSSTFFGAISGSAPATTSAVGAVMIPQMEEHGYDKSFTAAVAASSGTIGLIIPPSNNMVLYGTLAGASVGKMFLGGVIPGLIMAAAIITISYVISVKRGYRGEAGFSGQAVLHAFLDGIWALLMPLIILGGIYSGLFTPTEAAAVAVFYGLLVSVLVYRNLGWKGFKDTIFASASSTASIMFLVANAHIFSYLLSSEQIPQAFASFMVGVSSNPIVIKLIIVLALMVIGCFLDNAVAIILLTPIFYPVMASMGVDLCYFGVLMVFVLAIGQITPPVGLCLFVACDIGKVTIEGISKEIIPYIIGLVLVALLLVFCEPLVTFLPNLSGL